MRTVSMKKSENAENTSTKKGIIQFEEKNTKNQRIL